MKVETKYSIGDRVWAEIDGGYAPAQVRWVQYHIRQFDGDTHEAITYRLWAKRPNAPDMVKKHKFPAYEEREVLANEATLIKWQDEYAAREKRLHKGDKKVLGTSMPLTNDAEPKPSIYKLHDPRLG